MLLMFLIGNYQTRFQSKSLIFLEVSLEYSQSIFIMFFWLVILPLNNICSVLEVRLQIANQNVFNQRTCMQK